MQAGAESLPIENLTKSSCTGTVLRMYVTMSVASVTVADCEGSFSAIKVIKYLHKGQR